MSRRNKWILKGDSVWTWVIVLSPGVSCASWLLLSTADCSSWSCYTKVLACIHHTIAEFNMDLLVALVNQYTPFPSGIQEKHIHIAACKFRSGNCCWSLSFRLSPMWPLRSHTSHASSHWQVNKLSQLPAVDRRGAAWSWQAGTSTSITLTYPICKDRDPTSMCTICYMP